MPKRPTGTVGDTLISEMLFIHISFAILSYAAFTLTFVFAILYLVLYRLLKKKKVVASMDKTAIFTANEQLDECIILYWDPNAIYKFNIRV
ncbi:cytochrome c biogenesis protein [Lysinibacillus sp. MHQ-1]|nr:cytochrome c biogenesis protein [Lysinibacillus sp. MHQ-1]